MAETGVKYRNIGLLSHNFAKTVSEGYFVDKSLIIKDILDTGSEVTLITRPRRFGKSLILNMIKTFFEKTEKDNSVYFRDLDIWKCGERYTSEQGKYPVIYLDLKSVEFETFEKSYEFIASLLAKEFSRHEELRTSTKVTETDCNDYEDIYYERASETKVSQSLVLLSRMLAVHHGVNPIILIDEYDKPIKTAHDYGYYEKLMLLIRPLLSEALKNNDNLNFALLTGVTRVTKEGIFSGLNNLKVCSVLTDEYSQYFGFTEEEVDRILADYDSSEKKDEVCDWYNGYRFGTSRTQIYNPWSVVNYVMCGCEAKAYWVNTSGNGIIGAMLDSASDKVVKNLNILLDGGSIEEAIDENITYRELYEDPGNVYSMLLMSGYLKYVSERGGIYTLTVPNTEVGKIYNREIIKKIWGSEGVSSGLKVADAIKTKDAEGFRAALEHYITTSVHYENLKKEHAYENLAIGVFAALDNVYYVLTEDRLPSARSDQVLVPKEKFRSYLPAVVLEYERCDEEKDLEAKALAGRRQIDEKEYDVKLKALGYTDIFKMGVAFCGSHVVVKTESDVNTPE